MSQCSPFGGELWLSDKIINIYNIWIANNNIIYRRTKCHMQYLLILLNQVLNAFVHFFFSLHFCAVYNVLLFVCKTELDQWALLLIMKQWYDWVVLWSRANAMFIGDWMRIWNHRSCQSNANFSRVPSSFRHNQFKHTQVYHKDTIQFLWLEKMWSMSVHPQTYMHARTHTHTLNNWLLVIFPYLKTKQPIWWPMGLVCI